MSSVLIEIKNMELSKHKLLCFSLSYWASSTSKASCRKNSCLPNKGWYTYSFPTIEQLTKIHIINYFWSYQLEANYEGTAALGVKATLWSHIHSMVVVSVSGAQNLTLLSINKGARSMKSKILLPSAKSPELSRMPAGSMRESNSEPREVSGMRLS